MKEYICIDIGGTSIKYGVIGENRKFSETGETPTEAENGGEAVLEKAAVIVDRLRKGRRISGICVSTAGMVDPKEGKVVYAAPLIPGYTGIEIRKTMEERFHIPCSVENDVNCAGLAEALEGSGKGFPLCVCLTVGTGIANICYVLNPGVVILGGGIMAQREYLRGRIEKSMKKYLLPSVLQHTRLEFADNGNHAGMLGAYLCFLDRQA